VAGRRGNARSPDPTDSRRTGEILTAAVSHIGASPKRRLLEDRSRAGVIRTAGGVTMALGVVADGIGGENAGERAAELTVRLLFEHCQSSRDQNVPAVLDAALQEANRRVLTEARASRRKLNMGSTAAVAAIVQDRLYVANVGDSRVYLIRDGQAQRLTVDHTWAHEVVRAGKLSPAEASRHPRKDEIVRFVGQEGEFKVDLGVWTRGGSESESEARRAQGLPLRPGDRVVLCTDGLIKVRHDHPTAHYVEEAELPRLALDHPQSAANTMVKRALSRKVDDNVSVVVLEVPGGPRPFRVPYRPIGIGAGALLAAGALALVVPRLFGGGDNGPSLPVIPTLPSGVAYVSAFEGQVEVAPPGGSFRPVRREEILAGAAGMRFRTQGEGSFLQLALADQSLIVLGPESAIEVISIGEPGGTQESIVLLERGVAVLTRLANVRHPIVLTAPTGAMMSMIETLAGAVFNPGNGRFEVDCFAGACDLAFEGSASGGMRLRAGQRGWSDGTGSLRGPEPARHELYAFAGYAYGLVPTPTPTPRPTSTPTLTPTPVRLFFPPTATEEEHRPPPPPPPTNTPVPPTATEVPPTATETPRRPTKTEPPPEPTPTETPNETPPDE
jgi:protein phosphatase